MTPSPEFDQGEFVRALLDPDLPPPKGLKEAHGLRPCDGSRCIATMCSSD